jgi:hypothetical protein
MDTNKGEAEQCCSDVFSDFKDLLEDYSTESWLSFEQRNVCSELSVEQRVVAIRSVIDVTIADGDYDSISSYSSRFRNLMKHFGSELPAEQRIALVCSAISAAIKKDDFDGFTYLVRYYGSDLFSMEVFDGLIELIGLIEHGKQLKTEKPILSSWAIDQFKKVTVAYGIKTVEQALQVETEALIEAQSIVTSVNQLILAHQNYWSPSNEICKSDKVNVEKAFVRLYCIVEHAYQMFPSLYVPLHRIGGDME